MKRYSLQNVGAILFFMLLVYALAYFFGCSSVPVTSSTCDNIVSIFSVIGKSVCQSLGSSSGSTAALMKASGECQKVVIGSDTVDYSYSINSAGAVNIAWRSTSGLTGNVQVARANPKR